MRRNLRESITTKTKLVYVETPSNPTLDIMDLGEISFAARTVESNILVTALIHEQVL